MSPHSLIVTPIVALMEANIAIYSDKVEEL